MSIRKIRKAGQVKVFYSATYCGDGCFMCRKRYNSKMFRISKYVIRNAK